MNLNRKNTNKKIGNSLYQRECREYYKILREIHSRVFTSQAGKASEKNETRYTKANVEGIENLYSIINILIPLLKNRENVRGIDYGCGSHYFVDDLVNQYHWDVVGYDPDKNAVREAKKKYPANAKRYILCDLLKKSIPAPVSSHDFVFCNAVIQHFDYHQVGYMFEDVFGVLKDGGIFLLIFKIRPENWQDFQKSTGLKVNILDEEHGKIEIEDVSMKKALEELDSTSRSRINEKLLTGMRLLHFFTVDEIVKIATPKGFNIMESLQTTNGHPFNGIITYRSEKGIPAAAIFLIKNEQFEYPQESFPGSSSWNCQGRGYKSKKY